MDREAYATVRRGITDALGEVLKPVQQQLHALGDARDALDEAFGRGEPAAWCESCGMPLFEGDDFTTDDDGVSGCRRAMIEGDEGAPCYAPQEQRE